MDKQQFTAIYIKHKDWFLGWVEEIPGVNTQGKTLKEVKSNLTDALKLKIDINRELMNKELAALKIIKKIKEPILVSA